MTPFSDKDNGRFVNDELRRRRLPREIKLRLKSGDLNYNMFD